jgi:hypothetical protein
MTAITRTGLTGAALANPKLPRVGYDNILRDGIVSASSENAAGPVENAFNGLTYDSWMSTGSATEWIQVEPPGSPTWSETVDYMAVAAHTLQGCDVTPQSSEDGVIWDNLNSAFTVPDDTPFVLEFSAVSAPFFRLLIENAVASVAIGVLNMGEKLELERGLRAGWSPPTLNESIDYDTLISQGGQILSRNVVRRGAQARVTIDPATWLWARDSFGAFLDSAELHAFFFWWALEDRAEVLFGALKSHDVVFTSEVFVGVNMEIVGVNR